MIIFAHHCHDDCSLILQYKSNKGKITSLQLNQKKRGVVRSVMQFIKSLHPRKRSVTEDWSSHSGRGLSSHALWSAVNLTDLCHSLGLARAVLQQKSAIYYHPHHVQRLL